MFLCVVHTVVCVLLIACMSFRSLFAEFQSQFVLHPRRQLTVLTGESYSVECSAAQTLEPALTVTIHDDRGVMEGSVLAYTYPDSPGFPVYRVETATFQEPDCYFCITQSQPYNHLLIFGSQKSFVTVHGE